MITRRVRPTVAHRVFTLVVLLLVLAPLAVQSDDATACLPGVTVTDSDLFCSSQFRCDTAGFPNMQYMTSLDDEWACRCCPDGADVAAEACALAELSASHCMRYALGAWSASYGLCAECEYGYVLADSPYPSASCLLSCASILHCTDCGAGGVCQQCERGYVKSADSLSCDACPANCQDCLFGDTCTLCADGYTLFDGRCVECGVTHCEQCYGANLCNTCASSYALKDNECLACEPEHCASCSSTDPSICSACDAGFSALEDGSACVECTNANCQRCGAENVCAVCATGYTLGFTGACELCLVDHCNTCDSSADGRTCALCDDGYKFVDNGGACGEPQSWGYLMCLFLGVAAAVLAIIVLLLWCVDALCCLPQCGFVAPQLEEEQHLPMIGDECWRDNASFFLSSEVSFSKPKDVPLSSHDSEMTELPLAFTSTSMLDSPVKFKEVPALQQPATRRAAPTSEITLITPMEPTQKPAPPSVVEPSPPAQASPPAGVSELSQRRRRRVQFVLDDDVTDRYVPSSVPILANAMWDVVVAPVPLGVRGDSRRAESAPAVTYDDVQAFTPAPPTDETDVINTTSHRMANRQGSPLPVENPLSIPSKLVSASKPARRAGLSVDDSRNDAWDYGTVASSDDPFSDIAF